MRRSTVRMSLRHACDICPESTLRLHTCSPPLATMLPMRMLMTVMMMGGAAAAACADPDGVKKVFNFGKRRKAWRRGVRGHAPGRWRCPMAAVLR
eukprot:COSAG01_NODE_3562_length_5928_cov_183.820412_7_plen_95_part_00